MNRLEGPFLHLIKRLDSTKESAWRSIFTSKGQILLVSSVYKHHFNVPPEHLVKSVTQKLYSICSPVKPHYPQWSLVPCSVNQGTQSLPFCISHLHSCYLTAKNWVFLIFKSLLPSKRRLRLLISGRRNLNRGICHTPIFDLLTFFLQLARDQGHFGHVT